VADAVTAPDQVAAVTFADQERMIGQLTASVERQQTMITALVDAAERRLVRPSDESAYGRWEQNLVLHQEVNNRTQRIRSAERLLRSVVDSLDARMCILGDEGVIVGTNRLWDEFSHAMGWRSGEAAVAANFYTLIERLPVEIRGPLATAVGDVVAGTTDHASVKGHLPVGPGSEDVVVRVHPVRGHDAARAVVTMIDITGATRIQKELHRITEEAQLLALVAQHTDNAVVIADQAGRIEWANEAFCRMSGYRSHELLGLRRQDLMNGPFARTPAFRSFTAALAAGHGADVQFPTPTKDGCSYWVHVQMQPIVEDGKPVRFVTVERDITQQRAAEERLRAATRQAGVLADELSTEKSLLSDVLSAIPHLVYWKDEGLRYTGVNQAFLVLRGVAVKEDVLDRTESELDVPDELAEALNVIEPQVLATGEAVENRQIMLKTPDHRGLSLLLSVLPQTDDRGRVCGVIGVAADITHVTTLEQQVAQATRLESIGQLAAGIAHEINTPVQYVSDNTRFLAETFTGVLTALQAVDGLAVGDGELVVRLRDVLARVDLPFLGEEIPNALSQSQEGLTRVTQIVRALKDFSHPGQGRAEADLNRAVESTVQVSRNEWRYVAELDLDLDPEVGMVRCYEGELKQVLLNIVVNAAQAIATESERTGRQTLGRIQMRTQRLEAGVRIAIVDDGPGMDEAVRNKIFDPFYTTKPVGKGTGQGLSMAYASIVQKHGGKLSVSSAPGKGSTFVIDLPEDPAEAEGL
jgi:two-component system, NtrC family, sensor kinase